MEVILLPQTTCTRPRLPLPDWKVGVRGNTAEHDNLLLSRWEFCRSRKIGGNKMATPISPSVDFMRREWRMIGTKLIYQDEEPREGGFLAKGFSQSPVSRQEDKNTQGHVPAVHIHIQQATAKNVRVLAKETLLKPPFLGSWPQSRERLATKPLENMGLQASVCWFSRSTVLQSAQNMAKLRFFNCVSIDKHYKNSDIDLAVIPSTNFFSFCLCVRLFSTGSCSLLVCVACTPDSAT